MPLTLLDGTNSNIDLMIGTNSYKCQLSSIAFETTRETFQKTTFCSANWTVNINGMKSARFTGTGFPAKGTTAAKPFTNFITDSYPVLTFTADTGCTIVLPVVLTRETLGMIAQQNGSYAIEGINADGTMVVTWVTS